MNVVFYIQTLKLILFRFELSTLNWPRWIESSSEVNMSSRKGFDVMERKEVEPGGLERREVEPGGLERKEVEPGEPAIPNPVTWSSYIMNLFLWIGLSHIAGPPPSGVQVFLPPAPCLSI